MTEKPKTCQVCRLNPAEVKGRNSRGAPQWRCQTCHDLKNRGGFTNLVITPMKNLKALGVNTGGISR